MPRLRRKGKLSEQTMIMHTKNPGHVCDIEWKIDNVLNFPDETFTSRANLGRGCRTHLNIIIRIIDNGYYSSFYVGYERNDKQKTAVRVVFDLKLVSSKGDVYLHKKSKFSTRAEQKFQRVLKIRFADPDYFRSGRKLTEDELRNPDDDVIKKLVSYGLVVWDKESLHMLYSLPEDSITVKGSVKVFACCVPLKTKPLNESSSEGMSLEMENSELINDFKSAFINEMDNGHFTDVTFWLQEESVQAHKFILSARSPKFKRLLEPDSEGNSVSEMVIRGSDKYTFVHFLLYLYTGIVGEVKWEVLERLYELAIDFEINSLLEKCRYKFILSLKDRRADRALIFADKHKDEILKKETINFLKDIFFRYKNTIFWKSFRDNHPGLAAEVMSSVVDSFK